MKKQFPVVGFQFPEKLVEAVVRFWFPVSVEAGHPHGYIVVSPETSNEQLETVLSLLWKRTTGNWKLGSAYV